MTYSKEPELTLAEHNAYEHGKSHALSGWPQESKYDASYNHIQWYKFGYEHGLKELKKKALQDLVLQSP